MFAILIRKEPPNADEKLGDPHPRSPPYVVVVSVETPGWAGAVTRATPFFAVVSSKSVQAHLRTSKPRSRQRVVVGGQTFRPPRRRPENRSTPTLNNAGGWFAKPSRSRQAQAQYRRHHGLPAAYERFLQTPVILFPRHHRIVRGTQPNAPRLRNDPGFTGQAGGDGPWKYGNTVHESFSSDDRLPSSRPAARHHAADAPAQAAPYADATRPVAAPLGQGRRGGHRRTAAPACEFYETGPTPDCGSACSTPLASTTGPAAGSSRSRGPRPLHHRARGERPRSSAHARQHRRPAAGRL